MGVYTLYVQKELKPIKIVHREKDKYIFYWQETSKRRFCLGSSHHNLIPFVIPNTMNNL